MEYAVAHRLPHRQRTRSASMAVDRTHRGSKSTRHFHSEHVPRHIPMNPEVDNTSPRHGFSRRRTESRYVKEPERSRIKISHRRGGEYHNDESTYSTQHFTQTLSPRPFDARPTDYYVHGPEDLHTYEDEEESSSMHSEDSVDEDERSHPLTMGFPFKFFDPYEKSQESFAQTSLTSLGRGRIRGSKSIVGDESKSYRETIINVSSSRYVGISDSGQSCRAELILQPPAGRSEKGLSPLLNWI